VRFNSIGFQLFIFSALIIIASVIAVAVLGYRQARKAIVDEAEQHVLSVAFERKARLTTWLDQRHKSVSALVRTALTNPDGTESHDYKLLSSCMDQIRNFEGVLDVAVFDSHNRIILTGKTGGLWDDDLHCYFMDATKTDTTSGYCAVHLNQDQDPVTSLYIPILDKTGKKLDAYMLVEHATATTIDPIMSDSTSLGQSGEAFLVDKQTVMLTPSRLESHPAPLTHKMPIPPVIAAMDNDSGVMFYKNFSGNDVVGAYVTIPLYGWIVITELSAMEALSELKMIKVNTISAVAVALAIMLALALFLARRLTRPLDNMAGASKRIAAGDYAVRVPSPRRKDEIGRLVETFNSMVSGLERSRDELIQYHTKLMQSEKLAAIGQLAASIVHEMRSPLSSIKMNIQLLERETEKDSVEAKYLELARREMTRLETMLQELLDYSKPITLERKNIPLVDLLDSAIETTKSSAQEHQVKIEVEISDAPEEVWLDFEHTLRTLINLLKNSINASDAGGKIVLRCSIDPADLFNVEVIDQGSGMNERVLQRIFDPFFTTRDEGVGLGMNNIKKVVEAHHGEIFVESEPGKGTTVTIRLPYKGDHGKAISH